LNLQNAAQTPSKSKRTAKGMGNKSHKNRFGQIAAVSFLTHACPNLR